MGTRGPVPKRSTQRRRRNKTEPTDKATGAGEFERPPPGEGWHPVALAWFESLEHSGQSAFYEPSDWATAVLVAETMSRELQPRVIPQGDDPPLMVAMPITGSSMAALLKAMGSLMVTEGDRRRMRLELQRAAPDDGQAIPDVSQLSEYRRRAAARSD